MKKMCSNDYKKQYSEVVITPDSWLPRGEAIGRLGRIPVVIWQGIPGESANVHIYHRGKNRWLARFNEAYGKPDPRRVNPPCPRYSACGGCPLMHLDLEGQDLARMAIVQSAFKEYGIDAKAIEKTVRSPDGIEGYRHIVKLAAGLSDYGHIRLGAFGRNSRDIIPIPGCLAATDILRKTMKIVAHHVIDLGVQPVVEQGRGILRYVVARQSRASQQVLLTLVAARKARILYELARLIAQSVPEVVGIHLHLNDGPGNAIFAEDGTVVRKTTHLIGREEIEEEVADLRLRIGPCDFFQTNPGVAELLYRAVADEVIPDRPVVDLYCGVGGITQIAAKKTGWALGVDERESSVFRARQSAAQNQVPAEFMSGVVAETLPLLSHRLAGFHPTVIVNPARRGLEPGVLEAILALGPARIIYVSCNPRTLARDIHLALDRGFLLRRLIPFDMFPNTAHLEMMAVLDPQLPPVSSRPRLPRRHVAGSAPEALHPGCGKRKRSGDQKNSSGGKEVLLECSTNISWWIQGCPESEPISIAYTIDIPSRSLACAHPGISKKSPGPG